MPEGIRVNPAAMTRAADTFLATRDRLDGAREILGVLPILYLGQFEDATTLKQTIEAGYQDWSLALTVMSDACDDSGRALRRAATLLRDADDANDEFVLDDIDVIGK
ncbi:hypothetical protein ACFQZ4_43205 [Catellatospora coxensis]|uniref:Uncharacterized protein n=1 Tax=Catellatospora coxensis TaxID=310354 RepID=A0A8J3L518_9ACTN|nr:hypothetical protein [Catellatospora coxensis]GIG09249.1 hypothetical protein Cco03nite_59490 [Catellatospora coxensis]